MMGVPTWVLIALSFVSLMGFGFSGLLVSQAQERRLKVARRIRDVATPFRRGRTIELQAFRPAPTRDKSLIEMASSVFGFNPDRQDQYPIRWWAVLGIGFVVARIVAGFLVDVVGPFGLVSMPVLWVVLSRSFFGWAVGRRRELLLQQFPDTLAMICRSLRVGIPVLGAITGVAREAPVPTSLEFTKMANDLAVGVALTEAAKDLGIRNELAEYRFFATAIGLQAETGGGLSETLENLADLIRKRLALRERGHALSSEARTSSLILGALPMVLGGGLWLFNPAYMSVLYTTSAGRTVLGIATLSLGCGALTMRTIIKKTLT